MFYIFRDFSVLNGRSREKYVHPIFSEAKVLYNIFEMTKFDKWRADFQALGRRQREVRMVIKGQHETSCGLGTVQYIAQDDRYTNLQM